MVKVKNVSKTFHNKDGSKVRALRNVDIDLDDTGITFISGASGNGKSTLLSILAGLTRFDSGDIIVDGVSFKNFNRKDFDAYWRTYIGFVFEDYNLVETLNVRENIKLGVLADGRVPTEEQIGNVLKKVKLSGFEDRLVSQLSSGQRQRICIARTLIKHPRILFMDEPTAHLDDKNKALIWDMVKEMSKECLVISVSHDTQTVEKYADRIITLEENTALHCGFSFEPENGSCVQLGLSHNGTVTPLLYSSMICSLVRRALRNISSRSSLACFSRSSLWACS